MLNDSIRRPGKDGCMGWDGWECMTTRDRQKLVVSQSEDQVLRYAAFPSPSCQRKTVTVARIVLGVTYRLVARPKAPNPLGYTSKWTPKDEEMVALKG